MSSINEQFAKWAYQKISEQWDRWIGDNHISRNTKWVVAISGGKDSTVVAATATRKFGADRVVGLTLPCGVQSDYGDSVKVCRFLGISEFSLNIAPAVDSIIGGIEASGQKVSYDTRTNLPARIRMSATMALAQSVGGMMLNTSNLTESVVGYASLFGDDAGCYAPIKDLTVTEVIALGDWLGLPVELTHKTPVDGLQPLTDEDKLGMKYADIDRFIRNNEGSDDLKRHVLNLYRKNRFKTDIMNVPGPSLGLENYVKMYGNAKTI